MRAGANATLLIHEATFEPALEQQAREKRHSTTQEALDAGARMGAYRTLLTHFSQRYPRLPGGLDAHAVPWRRRGVVAFDGMRVPFALLPELPAIAPAMAVALSEIADEEEAGVVDLVSEDEQGGANSDSDGCEH